jgi:hypothetical protein
LLNPITGQLLREHLRQERGRHRIHDEDRPRRTPLSTQQVLHRAEKTGKHIGTLCRQLHEKYGETAVRRILGVLALAKNTASLPPTMPAQWLWKPAPANTTSYAVTWNAIHSCH